MYKETNWMFVNDDLCEEETQRDSMFRETNVNIVDSDMQTWPSVLWGWSLAEFLVSLWVWGPRHGESGSASRPGPEPGSSSLLHLKWIETKSIRRQQWLKSKTLDVTYFLDQLMSLLWPNWSGIKAQSYKIVEKTFLMEYQRDWEEVVQNP